MGVHDVEKYPEINRLLSMPVDEPIFIFRSQDQLTPTVIEFYRTLYELIGYQLEIPFEQRQFFGDELIASARNIQGWQVRNRDRVKFPD
jgi:hypothetical protein